MTTITYRDGVMAADSRAYSGNKVPIGEKIKLRRLDDGTLIGASTSTCGAAGWVLDWVEAGCPAVAGGTELLPDKFDVIVVRPDGSVFYGSDTPVLTGPLDAPYLAAGSGQEYALGAMAHGATAVEAVRAACLLDVWSGLPVYAVTRDGSVQKINNEE
jgi:ATP-dependent protease HslVU (ClpYQ) peptidase subunit